MWKSGDAVNADMDTRLKLGSFFSSIPWDYTLTFKNHASYV
jgi:hypothetical protein